MDSMITLLSKLADSKDISPWPLCLRQKFTSLALSPWLMPWIPSPWLSDLRLDLSTSSPWPWFTSLTYQRWTGVSENWRP